MLNLKVPWFCNRSAFITALYSLLNLIYDSV